MALAALLNLKIKEMYERRIKKKLLKDVYRNSMLALTIQINENKNKESSVKVGDKIKRPFE